MPMLTPPAPPVCAVSPKRSITSAFPAPALSSGEQAPIMRFVEAVVVSRPSVDVNHSARTDHQVAGVPNALSEYCGAKPRGQLQSAVIVRTRSTLRFLARTGLTLRRDYHTEDEHYG